MSWEDVQKLLDMYYQQCGWDQNGIPTREKLRELGLT
jgi:aldehyde:ferredoxin oxidoreductase